MPFKFHAYTCVWGDQYIDWMNRALVRSLSWPGNKAAMQACKWTIFGEREKVQRIFEVATQVVPFHQIDFQDLIFHSPGQVNMLQQMMRVMQKCLLDKQPMLTAPPDTVFSDGAVESLLDWAAQPGTCVAVPHPRVLPEIMLDLNATPPSNAELVTMALEKHPHKCWTTADMSLNVSGTYVGGLAWEKYGDKLWGVRHRLPTIYMSNFTDEDRKFFSRTYMGQPMQYGMWDHEWPGALVVGPEPVKEGKVWKVKSNQRQRTVGFSDDTFIVEVTDAWKNVPTQTLVNKGDPDAFHRNEFHNRINRQYIHQWRGA